MEVCRSLLCFVVRQLFKICLDFAKESTFGQLFGNNGLASEAVRRLRVNHSEVTLGYTSPAAPDGSDSHYL